MTRRECGLAAVVLGLGVGLAWNFLKLRRLRAQSHHQFDIQNSANAMTHERLSALEAAIYPKTPDDELDSDENLFGTE